MKKRCLILMLVIVLVSGLYFCETYTLSAATPTIGARYDWYASLSQSPTNPDISGGYVYREDYGIAKWESKEISNNIRETNKERHRDYPDLVYTIYKFYYPVNLVIEKHMPYFRYITPGSSYEYSVSHTSGTVLNYSISATAELSAKYGVSSELTVSGLNYAQSSNSAFSEVEQSISTTVSTSYTYTYSTTTTETYILSKDISGFYRLETRGLFYCYVIQTYKAEYKVVNKTHYGGPGIFGYDHWDYELQGYVLKEQNVKYSYAPDTSVIGFYRYEYSNSKYVFADIKENYIAYF